MLIVEIALGIVLGVLILHFWRAILSFGFLAIIGGGALLAVAAIVSFGIDNQKQVIEISFLIGFCIIIWLCGKFLQRKWPHLGLSDLIVGIVFLLFCARWMAAAIHSEGDGEWILIFLLFVFSLGFGFFMYLKNKRLLSEWEAKRANEAKLID